MLLILKGDYKLRQSKKRLIATLVIVAITSVTLLGCANKNINGEKAKNIVIWSHLSEMETNKLREYAEKWSKETGNRVDVHSDKGNEETYMLAVKANKSPDIEFGISSQTLGILKNEEVLDEAPSGIVNKNNYADIAVNAVTYDGKVYGMPISMDTYVLYYNKDKIKVPPTTIEELIAEGKKVGFQFDINNIYYSYPFLDMFGAYIFGEKNGVYDFTDRGLVNDNAIKGYKFLQDMIAKYNLIPNESKFSLSDAKENFKSGKIGLYISRLWDVDSFKNLKMNFGVATLPKSGNKYLRTIDDVDTAFVSSKSKNKKESWDLLKYISDSTAIEFYNTSKRIPVTKDALNDSRIKNDPIMGPAAEQAQRSNLVINIPELMVIEKINESFCNVTTKRTSANDYTKFVDFEIDEYLTKLNNNKGH